MREHTRCQKLLRVLNRLINASTRWVNVFLGGEAAVVNEVSTFAVVTLKSFWQSVLEGGILTQHIGTKDHHISSE